MILQRTAWDCGHACLAYVLGKTLDEVTSFMPQRELTDWEIGWALKIHRRNSPGHTVAMSKDGVRIVSVGTHWVVMEEWKVLCPSGRHWHIERDREGIWVKPER